MKTRLLKRLRKRARRQYFIVRDGGGYFVGSCAFFRGKRTTDYGEALRECEGLRRDYIMYYVDRYKDDRGYERVY